MFRRVAVPSDEPPQGIIRLFLMGEYGLNHELLGILYGYIEGCYVPSVVHWGPKSIDYVNYPTLYTEISTCASGIFWYYV
jgi:hypothetical protein